MTTFPIDDVTLAALRSSCIAAENDDGQSHLFDFLNFGTVVADTIQLASNVVEVTYAPGRAPWSPQSVIIALCDEIERLRSDRPGRADL